MDLVNRAASGPVLIVNRAGLHARAAAVLVQSSARFKSKIEIGRDGEWVNAKSIMGVMMLAAIAGSRVEFRAEGPDAEEAVSAMVRLVESGFGEDRAGAPPAGEE